MMLALAYLAVTSSINVGELAPPFSVKDQLGITRKLADYRGKTVVLAFFPGDFTPGCTAEVRAFRNTMPKIENRDAVVFGISGNDLATRQRFAAQERLNFPLLIDEDHTLANLYEVKLNQGRPERATIIIGTDGRIVGVDRDVDRQFSKTGDTLVSHHADNLALFLSDWNGELGQTIPPFWLEGDQATISTFHPESAATVYWFADPECPVTQSGADDLAKLVADPLLARVGWLGIGSRPSVTSRGLAAFAQSKKLLFEFGIDRNATYAHRFGATETGEVWVTDQESRVVYRGAADPRLLREALYAVMAGRPVPVREYHAPTHGLPIP